MGQEEKQLNSLPDNAYRELKPGEEYKPVMPAGSKPKEVTVYSVTFGIIMAIIFSAAAAHPAPKSFIFFPICGTKPVAVTPTRK